MVKIDIDYTGDLRCTARHGPSGVTLQTDAPVDNHGRGELFSPTDLVATGLGTCMATILGIAAERKGWNLGGMRVQVVKEMTQTSPRRIASLSVELFMPEGIAESDRPLIEKMVHSCPVHQSLHPDIRVPITVHWPI